MQLYPSLWRREPWIRPFMNVCPGHVFLVSRTLLRPLPLSSRRLEEVRLPLHQPNHQAKTHHVQSETREKSVCKKMWCSSEALGSHPKDPQLHQLDTPKPDTQPWGIDGDRQVSNGLEVNPWEHCSHTKCPGAYQSGGSGGSGGGSGGSGADDMHQRATLSWHMKSCT